MALLEAREVSSWAPTALRPELPRAAAVESETNSLHFRSTQSITYSLLKLVALLEARDVLLWLKSGPVALRPELPRAAAVESE